MGEEAAEQTLQDPEVTQLLAQFRSGDRDAESRLVSLVYAELRRMALLCLNRERPDHTLQPTALVHETFLRLAKGNQPQWEDRVHFFAVAGRLMRQILVDYARRHHAGKRGGPRERIPLGENLIFSEHKPHQLLALDEALCRLAKQDDRQSRIVEMKFFAGLNVDEMAEILQISPRTVKREWTMARAWLHREMTG
ncbi:MAG TPA: sigma-70 family RNA polymerase sigma factor [Bryobacteraceae bacterium]|nr:sigma-70 family RNA polymerase sigma factor [Bryobacteraceae bacterium]